MQNGIYRVWLKGPHGDSAGAMLLQNGMMLGCDHAYASVGRYIVRAGRLVGEVQCTRLDKEAKTESLPDLDEFHLHLDGVVGPEFAALRATVPEVPGYNLICEFARTCDA